MFDHCMQLEGNPLKFIKLNNMVSFAIYLFLPEIHLKTVLHCYDFTQS